MPMASGPDRYLVVGNPIAHSRSPEIHAAFAAQTGQHILYERRLIETDPPEAFAAAMRHFFQDEGGRGANVTLPFKEAAFRLADERSPRAEAAGAANTLCFIEGRIIADNTDGAGLVDDIQRRLGVSLQGLRVTVLGAGGAARGLMLPAQALPVRVEPVALADAPAADVLINATSAGLHGDGPSLPARLFEGCRLAYDCIYADRPTPFMQQAMAAGVSRVSDGLGMLVGQAAESFRLGRGSRPDVVPVLEALRTAR